MELIRRASYEAAEQEEEMFRMMEIWRDRCIYCWMRKGVEDQGHSYEQCRDGQRDGFGMEEFGRWRRQIELGQEDCWRCGLSQEVCAKVGDSGECEWGGIIFVVIFYLNKGEKLKEIVEGVGFQGTYEAEMWEWIREGAEGVGITQRWESNWMRIWREVCRIGWEIEVEFRREDNSNRE